MDTEKGERLQSNLERHLGDNELRVDARRKLSWDLDREKGGEAPPISPPPQEGKHVSIMDNRRKSFGERDDYHNAERDSEWGGSDRTVERRRWDMEREIEMEKWKKQGQLEKDHERTKWKLEKDKELDRLKKYYELEKVYQSNVAKDKNINNHEGICTERERTIKKRQRQIHKRATNTTGGTGTHCYFLTFEKYLHFIDG